MSSPNPTNNFLILLPTTHASFDASPALTEEISVSIPTKQKTQRSSSMTSATSAISDNNSSSNAVSPGPAAGDPAAVIFGSFGKAGYLWLGN